MNAKTMSGCEIGTWPCCACMSSMPIGCLMMPGPSTAGLMVGRSGSGGGDKAESTAPPSSKARAKAQKRGGKPVVPRDWDFGAARRLFAAPAVVDANDLDLAPTAPDYDGLRAFLVGDFDFNADRVDKMLGRLRKCRAQKPQKRIDDFFAKATKPPPPPAEAPHAASPAAAAPPASPAAAAPRQVPTRADEPLASCEPPASLASRR